MPRKRVLMWLSVLLLTLAGALPAGADRPAQQSGPMIYLARASFDPLAGEPALEGMPAALLQPAPDSDVFLLQFDGPVQDEWKASVEASGVELLSYLPDHAYLARTAGGETGAAGKLPHVRWVGSYRAAYKIQPSLDALAPETVVPLMVRLFRGEDRPAAEAALRALGAPIEEIAASELLGDAVKTTLPAGRIADLAALAAVAWIEPALPMQLANDRARAIMQVNTTWTALAGLGTNLYGAGQIVDVTDTGLDTGNAATLNQDFRDRFVKAYTWGDRGTWNDTNGHGTHVAGSVLGSGRSSGSLPASHNYGASFAGVAPEASLVFQSLLNSTGGLAVPSDLKQLFGPAHVDGARIHSNSWGHPTGGTYPFYTYGAYDSASAYADEFMWLNPTSLLVFAAGNNGVDANADGVIDLDQVMSPATAKSVVAVGATENNRPPGSGFGGYSNMNWGVGSWAQKYPVNPIFGDFISDNTSGLAAFSSRGPTDDGRGKPEIVAPGTDIISVRSAAPGAGTGWGVYDANYVYNGGTSMATPLTAGAAALVRQFYTDVQHAMNPSAALVKATLLNGGQNITPGQYGAGAEREIPANTPNNVIGYGRLDLMNALALYPNLRLSYRDDAAGLGTGSIMTHTVYITQAAAAGSRLAATLAWSDFPGTVGAGKMLVNDLDLEVIDPDGVHYKGNGQAIWDRLNTTEQVLIAAPKAGAYRIVVRGAVVPQGPQPYALVAVAPYLSTTPGLANKVRLPLIVRGYGSGAPTSTPTPTPTPTPTTTPTATPTSTPPGPQPGFWQDDPGSVAFYVTADRSFVDDFTVHVTVPGCGDYAITHNQAELIVGGAFSFAGSFYADGAFYSSTSAIGAAGLDNYYIAGCGYVSSDTAWGYAATWRWPAAAPADQPAILKTAPRDAGHAFIATRVAP